MSGDGARALSNFYAARSAFKTVALERVAAA
jgi:hypothetical protein